MEFNIKYLKFIMSNNSIKISNSWMIVIVLFLLNSFFRPYLLIGKVIIEDPVTDENRIEDYPQVEQTFNSEYKLGLGTDFNDMIYYNLDLGVRIYKDIFLGFMLRSGHEATFLDFSRSYPEKKLNSYAFSIGSSFNDKSYSYLYLSYAVGIGLISGTTRGKFLYSKGWLFGDQFYRRIDFNSICLPIKVEMGVRFSVIGLTSSFELTFSNIKPLFINSYKFCLFL